MPTEIKAIETHYAGCRFRSRLEARWAVFFDTLGIIWQYEEEGFDLPSGRYLPDFRISGNLLSNDNTIWAEVKGSLDHVGLVRLLRAVYEMPKMGPHPVEGRMLILGPIPRPGTAWNHVRIDVSEGRFGFTNAFFQSGDWPNISLIGETVLYRRSWIDEMTPEQTAPLCDWLVGETWTPRLNIDPWVDDAYRAARSARFEYGERG